MGVDLSLFNANLGKVRNNIKDYDEDLALKTLEVIYLNTNFLGLEEAIKTGYIWRRKVMNYVSEMSCSVRKFNDMFRDVYRTLSMLDLGDNCLRYKYPLYICGERRGTYRIVGYDFETNTFVIPRGTVFDEIPDYYHTNVGCSRYIKIVKSLGNSSIKEHTGAVKTVVIGTMYMESPNKVNTTELEEIFETFRNKYRALQYLRFATNFSNIGAVRPDMIDGKYFTNKSPRQNTECYFCRTNVLDAVINGYGDYFSSKRYDLYRGMVDDLIRKRNTIDVTVAPSIDTLIVMFLHELSFYNPKEDNICITKAGEKALNEMRSCIGGMVI